MFRLLTLAVFISLCSLSITRASVVAIIDSGVDYRHEAIAPNNQWKNPIDSWNNDEDEDGNGLVDDTYGWNFAENNKMVIDYKYLGTFSRDVYKFFDVQLKMMLGTASDADVKWMRAKRGDEEFIKELSKFANFVHGTHVAGISVKDSAAKELAVKLIPTEVGSFVGKYNSLHWEAINSGELKDGINDFLIRLLINQLVKQQMDQLEVIGQYVDSHKAHVANGSFGTGWAQAEMICKMFLGEDAEEGSVYDCAEYFMTSLVNEGLRFVRAAPNTLFVFAAGNSGTDNDVYPTSPANIQSHNTMAVAALLDLETIAPFSCYGVEHVDVAAPGVGITSSIPGDEYLKVSGTSQAAPYVTNVAARVFDLNNHLGPAEIKRIIMETVDKKDYLANKVRSGGLVNLKRALRAAELSSEYALHRSIEMARTEVPDQQQDKSVVLPQAGNFVLPLPSFFSL